MSNGMPYVRWHGRDWIGDPLLRMVGPEVRGVWIDLLCIMMQSEPYGHLTVKNRAMTDEETARMIGISTDTYKGILYRLEEVGIPSRTPDGILYSRRLVRDYKRFMTGRESGLRGGGNPRLRGNKPEARIHKPEAKGGLKVPYIGPPEGSQLALSASFSKAWKEWVTARSAMKAPKDWSRMYAKQLEWLSKYAPDVATEILNRSMRNGWQGLFEPERNAAKPARGMENHI